jgi:hypothetical protein
MYSCAMRRFSCASVNSYVAEEIVIDPLTNEKIPPVTISITVNAIISSRREKPL